MKDSSYHDTKIKHHHLPLLSHKNISNINGVHEYQANYIRLPDPPEIIIRRFDPTNYQEYGNIYISPDRIEQ